MLSQKCFFFREIHGKDSDKYSRKQVSDKFKIIKVNWVRISRAKEKNGFKLNKN